MKNPEAASPLAAHLGYWLRFVSNHVSHGFSLRIAAHDVTVAEWVVLRELFDEPSLLPSVLAERLGMTRGAISKLSERLATKGFLERIADTRDRRSHALALTAVGRKLVPVLSSVADRNDEAFFGHLDPAERATIERIMKEIVQRQGLRTIPID